MNPFDFYGPQFLVFYVAFSIFIFIVTAIARRFVDGTVIDRPIDPAQVVSDPYLVAYLRGGAPEAMRTATISLVDRELLTATGTKLKAHENVRSAHARHPLEQQILLKYKHSGEAAEMFSDGNVRNACDGYEAKLRELGLLPDHRVTAARKALYLVMAAVLALVSIIKIVVALSRGRTNVAFLIVLTVIAIALLRKFAFTNQTSRGKEMLEDVRRLFSGLKGRGGSIPLHGETTELAMLVAVFGVNAAPARTREWTQQVFPQASSSSGSSSSSCGASSSCGSSSSSSCGSSCGGGCGGGCGGCGS